MTRPAEPARDPATDPARPSPRAGLVIVVERTGGFAGLVRRWSVTASADDDRWRALVEACPWEAVEASDTAEPSASEGADRFCWSVAARCDDGERHAELAEHEADGPWRSLIDAVRDADATGRADAAGA